MRKLTLTLSFSLLFSPIAPALDLKGAVRYALEHSPSLSSDREGVKIREWEHASTRARLLPSLDLSSTHGLQSSETKASTDPWASSVGIKLSETIYDNGQSWTQHRLAGLRRDIAAVALDQARDQLCLDVATQFFAYSLSVKLAEVKHRQAELLGKQFASVSDQYRQGIKARKDFLRFKTQLTRAEIDERNALADIERSRISLAKLLGVPAGETLELEPVSLPSGEPKVPETAPPLDGSHEYRVAKASLSQTPLEVSLAERRYWPEVNLSAGANYGASGYLGGEGARNYGWNVLLSLNYNLWDWGIRRRDVEIAESRAHIAENSFRKAVLEAEAGIRNLMLDLPRAMDNFKIARELVEAESESHDSLKREYAEGKVPYLDLITALTNLLDSKVRFYTAYFDLAGNLMKYRYYSGDLHASILNP